MSPSAQMPALDRPWPASAAIGAIRQSYPEPPDPQLIPAYATLILMALRFMAILPGMDRKATVSPSPHKSRPFNHLGEWA